jgi:hypothetical protein
VDFSRVPASISEIERGIGEILRCACLPCLPAGGRRRAQDDIKKIVILSPGFAGTKNLSDHSRTAPSRTLSLA